MSRVLVFGAGFMGRALAWDLCRQPGVERVHVVDISPERLRDTEALVASPKARFSHLSVEDSDGVDRALEGVSLALGAVSYQYNARFTDTCIRAGAHFVDLGGNDAIVDAQFAMHDRAKAAGVAILPDCGLAPGLAGILGMHVYNQLPGCDEIHLRVGGLPQHPVPPLDYMLVFSVHGLINEYKEPVRILEEGALKTVPGMSHVEEITFPAPFGPMEAFYTSGGVSTLVKTLEGRVRDMDYKTIRYPGHAARIQLLMDLGFFDEAAGPDGRSPRDFTEAHLAQRLALKDQDLILLRVWGRNTARSLTYECIDREDPTTGLTAMMRMTAFPAAIIGQMLLSGEIPGRGVLRQELAVPADRMIAELARRGVEIREQ